jgi:hypothetical protein
MHVRHPRRQTADTDQARDRGGAERPKHQGVGVVPQYAFTQYVSIPGEIWM